MEAAGQPAAIVAAGGRGERAAGDAPGPKQFREVAGRPLVVWSIEALTAAGCSPIVVVVPEDHLSEAESLLGSLEVVIAPGGATRQASVASGLDEISAEVVVIHDGARPLVTPELVQETLARLDRYDAAIVGMPMDETLKVADGEKVGATVDRSSLWRVQTPQAFRTDALRRAHDRAAADGFVGTDDAQLIERDGGSVALVRGSRLNIKVTYAEDFLLAEALLVKR